MKKILFCLALLSAVRAEAAWINLPAAAANLPSSNAATKTTRSGLQPAVNLEFANGSVTCAVWRITTPQDHATGGFTCYVDQLGGGGSGNNCYTMAGVSYANLTTIDPSLNMVTGQGAVESSMVCRSQVGTDSLNGALTSSGIAFTPRAVTSTSPAYPTPNPCSGTACQNNVTFLRLCRQGDDVSDTSSTISQVTSIRCEY